MIKISSKREVKIALIISGESMAADRKCGRSVIS